MTLNRLATVSGLAPSAGRHACMALTLALAAALAPGAAQAGPGAHGPNGEHLDAPAVAAAGPRLPRLEASSEQFELVATLTDTELSVLVDRFASNEPVLGARLEVEVGELKSVATFHADHGDYAFDDPKLLQRLKGAGEHALVFTLVAGAESDLLDGTLVTGAATDDHAHDDGHGHDHELERAAWIGAGVAGLAALGALGWWRQRRAAPRPLQGGL